MTTLVLAHVAATWFMAGVIAFVQVVHYPLMDGVDRERFPAYEARHARLTTWVVGPPMLVEAATALVLALHPASPVPSPHAWAGLVAVVAIWLSTALLQVPCHRRLEAGFDEATHRRLVVSNGLRTALWWARAILVTVWLVQFKSQIFAFSAPA